MTSKDIHSSGSISYFHFHESIPWKLTTRFIVPLVLEFQVLSHSPHVFLVKDFCHIYILFLMLTQRLWKKGDGQKIQFVTNVIEFWHENTLLLLQPRTPIKINFFKNSFFTEIHQWLLLHFLKVIKQLFRKVWTSTD